MIKLAYASAEQLADLQRDGANLETDAGLETIVTISMLSDGRANKDEVNTKEQDPRGWWGESFLGQPGRFGSRLWLLRRNKLTGDNLALACEYAKESIQWLINARVAKSVEVTSSLMPGRKDVALIRVQIERQRGNAPRFDRVWEVQFGN